MKYKRFEDLPVWQAAIDLAARVFRLVENRSFTGRGDLRNQLQRAAASISNNIAEGFESRTQTQFISYLGHAKASAGELRSQLYVALDAGYLDRAQFDPLFDTAEKCSRQLSRFISYLESQPNARRVREQTVQYEIDASQRPNLPTS